MVDPVLTEVRYSFAQVQPVHVIMLPDHVDYMYNLFMYNYAVYAINQVYMNLHY